MKFNLRTTMVIVFSTLSCATLHAEDVCQKQMGNELKKVGLELNPEKIVSMKAPREVADERLKTIEVKMSQTRVNFQKDTFKAIKKMIKPTMAEDGIEEKMNLERQSLLDQASDVAQKSEDLSRLARLMSDVREEKKKTRDSFDWLKETCLVEVNSKLCQDSKILPDLEYKLIEDLKLAQKGFDATESQMFDLLKELKLDPSAIDFPFFTLSKTYKNPNGEYPSAIFYYQGAMPLAMVIKRGPYESETLTKFDKNCEPKAWTNEWQGTQIKIGSEKDCRRIAALAPTSADSLYKMIDDRCQSLFNVSVLKTSGTSTTNGSKTKAETPPAN